MSEKPSPTRPQLVYDRTSYGLIPTPPSPTQHSPGLLSPSNSISYSSNSPPEPTTPPHTPRSRSRYSDLGRVPLHRRGNSKTYERLEDLLKEAGYKETRIFTPETERSSDGPDGAAENRLSVRDGMEAVVGFFAGLLPGAMTSKTSLVPESDNGGPAQDYLPSPSPLTIRALQRQAIGAGRYDPPEPPTPPTMTSSLESLGEPTSTLIRHHSANTVSLHPPPTNHSQRPSLSHRNSSQFSQQQASRSSLHHQAIQQHHHSNIVSPRPSRPSVYLRHMSSPSVLPRPNSTPAHLNKPAIFVSDNNSSTRDGHDANLPPLPPSWLESVTRAVLFGGTGAYIGGPSSFTSHDSFAGRPSSPSFAKTHFLRTTRSSSSQLSSRKSKYHRQPMNRRSGLSDQTNSPIPGSRSTFLGPPSLFHQIERGRSRRSEGEVSRTRVMCRSAPGSRSGSVTRDDGGQERRKKSRKKEENARLPSLARTQAEGDVWDREKNEGRTRGASSNSNRYVSGWGASDAHSEAGSSSEEEEEEDGELDLARILVPPKRQNSIRSLRRHLASEASLGPSAHSSLKSYAARTGSTGRRRSGREVNRDRNGHQHHHWGIPSRQREEDWDGESQEEWGCGWVRKGAGNRESEDDDSFVGFFGEGRTSLTAAGTRKTGSGGNRLGFRGLMGGQ